MYDGLLPCHTANIPFAKLMTLACTRPFQMTGNLENLIRHKVMFLCPATQYNFCLTNCHLGQDKLLLLLAQCKRWWHGGVLPSLGCLLHKTSFLLIWLPCRKECTIPPSVPCRLTELQGTSVTVLRSVCFLPRLGDFSGAERPQYFKALWEYSHLSTS